MPDFKLENTQVEFGRSILEKKTNNKAEKDAEKARASAEKSLSDLKKKRSNL